MHIEWDEHKVEQVAWAIEAWMHKYQVSSGEGLMQDDAALISAPDMLGDIIDDIICPEFED